MKSQILLSLLNAPFVSGAVVTLYDVLPAPTPPPSHRFSVQVDGTTQYVAVNPSQGSDVTTYVVEEVLIKAIVIERNKTATSTFTVLSTPTTVEYTRIEGESHMHIANPGGPSTPTALPNFQFALWGLYQDCQLYVEKDKGECIRKYVIPAVGVVITTDAGGPTTITSIVTVTYQEMFTGTLVPVTTVTTSGTSRSTNTFWSALGFLASIFMLVDMLCLI